MLHMHKKKKKITKNLNNKNHHRAAIQVFIPMDSAVSQFLKNQTFWLSISKENNWKTRLKTQEFKTPQAKEPGRHIVVLD